MRKTRAINEKGTVCYRLAMPPSVFSGTYRGILAYFETDFNWACCKDSETTLKNSEIPMDN